MKAVWYEKTGDAQDVLRFGEIETPRPSKGEVLVRLHASGVNPSDVKARGGTRGGASSMPYPRIVPHSDGAGVIEAVGMGVDSARVGQRVWVWNAQWQRAFGTAAEYVALPEEQVASLPADVSFEVGASLGIPAVTAAHTVLGAGPVDGRTVLISGGAGTVGRLAVQIARANGARVIATVGSAEQAERAKSAGASAVVRFDEEGLADRILAANDSRPVDLAVEVEFGANIQTLAKVIKPRGRIVTYGSAAVLRPELPFYALLFKGVTIEFVLVYLLNDAERRRAVAAVESALADGLLDVPIHARYGLGDCAEAHHAVETGRRVGSVVVLP